jgi:hypothetical protein
MSRSLLAALEKLRESYSGTLPASALSSAQRRSLETFAQTTKSVQMRPSGRGVVFEITQPSIVDKHWRDLSPVDVLDLDVDLPNRAKNIATNRSSKSQEHLHDVHYLLLKAGKGSVTWVDDAGHQLDLRQTTDQQGAAAFAIRENNSWATDGVLWLVEIQALFDRLEWLPDELNTSVAYYSGNLRNSFLEWLAAKPRAKTIWFFPDYDGVGLMNYARIKACLGNKVHFWLMQEWETKLTHFGYDTLWKDTFRDFQSAQERLTKLQIEPELLQLMQSMQIHGLALEQEAIWLETSDIE